MATGGAETATRPHDGAGSAGRHRPVAEAKVPTAAALPAAPRESIEEEPYGERRVALNLSARGREATIAALRARGLLVAGPRDGGYARFTWVHDPDAKVVEPWQPSATHPPA